MQSVWINSITINAYLASGLDACPYPIIIIIMIIIIIIIIIIITIIIIMLYLYSAISL